MGYISNAVGDERISRVTGYQITKAQQAITGVNLPQRIAILAPTNNANQAGLGLNPEPYEVTSTKEAGDIFGYGSPVYQIMRILRPVFGGGIGGIPTVVYPQLEAVGSTATTIDIDVSGTPTQNIAHRLIINGRDSIDGEVYEFLITTTDTPATIRGKIVDAINNVLSSPVIAAINVDKVTATTKWRGATSAGLEVSIDTRGNSAGLTYTINNKVDGTGTESITDSIEQMKLHWNTIVINAYGTAQFDSLEAFNGTPSTTTPTGRYAGIVFKPFVSFWGSSESSKTTLEAITNANARLDQVTHVLCPCPNSSGWEWEAAANGALIQARISQNSPHRDILGQSYTDMPIPLDSLIGDMSDYENRDYLVKKGASTVDLVNGKYQIQDLITTYNVAGEIPPQFRYVRNLIVDWNIYYGYNLLLQQYVEGKTIALDDTFVSVDNVIKPKDWRAILYDYADDLAARALIADARYMKDSIEINIGQNNPDRLETSFGYQRTGTARIAATTAEANFIYSLD